MLVLRVQRLQDHLSTGERNLGAQEHESRLGVVHLENSVRRDCRMIRLGGCPHDAQSHEELCTSKGYCPIIHIRRIAYARPDLSPYEICFWLGVTVVKMSKGGDV